MISDSSAESILGKFVCVTPVANRGLVMYMAYRQIVAVDAFEESRSMRQGLTVFLNRKVSHPFLSGIYEEGGVDTVMLSPTDDPDRFEGYFLSREGVRVEVRVLR